MFVFPLTAVIDRENKSGQRKSFRVAMFRVFHRNGTSPPRIRTLSPPHLGKIQQLNQQDKYPAPRLSGRSTCVLQSGIPRGTFNINGQYRELAGDSGSIRPTPESPDPPRFFEMSQRHTSKWIDPYLTEIKRIIFKFGRLYRPINYHDDNERCYKVHECNFVYIQKSTIL